MKNFHDFAKLLVGYLKYKMVVIIHVENTISVK